MQNQNTPAQPQPAGQGQVAQQPVNHFFDMVSPSLVSKKHSPSLCVSGLWYKHNCTRRKSWSWGYVYYKALFGSYL